MITYHIALRGSDLYTAAEDFAREIYLAYYDFFGTHRVDVLAVAQRSGTIVGVIGLIYVDENPCFFEQCDPPHPFERLAGTTPKRSECGEISRLAMLPGLKRRDKYQIIASTAIHLLRYAYTQGLRYFGFAGSESFCRVLDTLEIPSMQLGMLDLSHNPDLDRFARYLETPRVCVGFTLNEHTPICQHTIDDVSQGT